MARKPGDTSFPYWTPLDKVYPEVAKQWHPTLNGLLTPNDVSRASGKRVWWLCEAGHTWNTTVQSRKGGLCGCPFCAGRRMTPDKTLAGRAPETAAWWSPDNERPATIVSVHDKGRAQWLCPQGHSFTAHIFAMVRKPACPECNVVVREQRGVQSRTCRIGRTDECTARCRCSRNGRPPIPGAKSGGGPLRKEPLTVTDPELADEWHPVLNLRRPEDVTRGMEIDVWWRCPFDPFHQWVTQLTSRTGRSGYKPGCPKCWRLRRGRSAMEQRLRAHLATEQGFESQRVDAVGGSGRLWEVDMIRRTDRVVVEYDGTYWHASEMMQERDHNKTADLVAGGWTVIRVREAPLGLIGPHDISVTAAHRADKEAVLKEVTDHICKVARS